MFYSYKGGSGRTVAVANVASAFCKHGKRVAVVDLDFEAPGLHHLFAADQTRQFRRGKGIQHYLKGEINLHSLLDETVIDVFGIDGPLSMHAVPKGSSLLYFLASTKVTQVDAHSPQVNERMKALIAALESKVDFLIIDAASGVRDSYSIAAEVSDEMYMFFRWSTQHVEGTILMAQYMKLLKEFGKSSISFQVVASATPSENELDALDPDSRQSFVKLRKHIRDRIEAELEECMIDPPKIFHDIPEMIALKWRETVVVFSEQSTEYEVLAQKILNNHVERSAHASAP